MKKQSDSYHTARQPYSETDIALGGSFGDGHEHCREVEEQLRAERDAALQAFAESEACRAELRLLVAGGLRGGR